MSTMASAIANKMKLTLNPSIELLADGLSLSSRCGFCCVDISNPSLRTKRAHDCESIALRAALKQRDHIVEHDGSNPHIGSLTSSTGRFFIFGWSMCI